MHYLGPRSLEDLVREIEDCDVGVIPNHRSAFSEINTPTRIFEYLALGKPVIAPRAAGICDYFDDRSLVLLRAWERRGSGARASSTCSFILTRQSRQVRRGQEVYREHSWRRERGDSRAGCWSPVRRTQPEPHVPLGIAPQSSLQQKKIERQLLKAGHRPQVLMEMRRNCNLRRQGPGDDASGAAATVREDDMDQHRSLPAYVLITPARNEEAFIEKTIES